MRNDMASITNEGLAIEIKNLSIQIADLKTIIAQNASDYVRKEVFELKFKELELQITMTHKSILDLENRKSFINWITPTISAILASVMTFLIIQNLGK